MPKLESQIRKENMNKALTCALIRRGFKANSLGKDLGERLGRCDKTGRKLLNDPTLLTVGDIQALKLNDEEILSIVKGEL